MAKKISYRYEAIDDKSFTSLATSIIECGAVLTINPTDKSIIAQIDEAQYGSDNDPIRAIGTIIDDNALNFHIAPVEIVDFAEQVESLKKDLEQVKKDKDYYVNGYFKEMDRITGIKKQIESIGVLLDLIQKS
ncbi:MAG: hypothetical protein ACI304_03020 [Lepagella sp.]